MSPISKTFRILLLALLSISASGASIQAADKYAAIAYSTTSTRFGYSSNYDTRAAAETAAYRNSNARDARIVIWCRNNWCALARSNSGTGWGAAYAATQKEASLQALKNCPNVKEDGKRIVVSVFSGS